MQRTALRARATTLLLASLGAGCSDDAEEQQPVSFSFDVRVHGAAFQCDAEYPDLGEPPLPFELTDARFYAYDFELADGSGKTYPVSLDSSAFQGRGVALLDFEDGCGVDGTPEMNSSVHGRVPPGAYTTLRFTLGVPAPENFENLTAQPAPLDVTGMFWTWQSGYKYLKIDGFSRDAENGLRPFVLHLGASGCPGPNPNAPPTGDCAAPNRVTYELTGFDPSSSVIVADVGELFAESNLAVNTDGTGQGCQSEPKDPECATLFPRVGIDDASKQVLFHLE